MEFSYIKSITLNGFCNCNRLVWNTLKGVNVLSGVNGSGKSTLIGALAHLFQKSELFNIHTKPYSEIRVEFENGSTISSLTHSWESKPTNIYFITSVDSPLISSEALQKITSGRINSELDWELYKVLDKFIRYQLAMGKKAIELLLGGAKAEDVTWLTRGKELYFELLDSLLSDSGKSVLRQSDELMFQIGSTQISPYSLSAGEKQLIIILTSVLVQNNEPYILVMDEPEISLHHTWQRRLLASILELNPNVQVITTTHSPAMIMDGWMDRITDISEICDGEA